MPSLRNTVTGPRLAAILLAIIIPALTIGHALAAADELEAQKTTIDTMRQLGNAMSSWLTENARGQPRADSSFSSQRSPGPFQWRCQVRDAAELAALLVPAYISKVPVNDAWGRPFQFCLTDDLESARVVLGIRSGGADGAFDGGGYVVSAFPSAQPTRDIVWVNGYFVRWPEP